MKRGLIAFGIVALSFSSNEAGAQRPPLETALQAIERSDWGDAERRLSALTSSGKDRAASWLSLARVQLKTGRYAEAAESAKRATSLDKKLRIEALPVQAEALSRRGKIDEAIRLLEALEREPAALRARLSLGELYLQTGRSAEARGQLLTLIDAYNDGTIRKTDAEALALVGRAAHLLRSARDANDAYAESERAGKRVETLLFRADLFLEKYDPGHAEEVVREALAMAPNDADALVAMAKVKLDQMLDFGTAERSIERALAINPNHARAYVVKAGIALRDMDLDAADRACEAGLAINPNDLELLSMKAAVRFLADDVEGYERIRSQVFAKNAEYSTFHRIVGEFAEWEHRYDEIVAMMREATRIDPRDGRAFADMGLNLLRAGDEAAGLDALRRAWSLDKFNVRVFNTLNLYEDIIETSYETVEHGPFRIRYAKSERPVLSRYVPRMLDEAWASMTKRYGFVPEAPVAIELYASAEHFSVRTSGLPNIGIQGVCFGKTLAVMSPSAQAFNWGNVLWHELAHVFAIQLSKNRVPRWYTEGLSEYETIIARPEWQREEDPALYLALEKGRIPPIRDLNRAFTRAEDARDVATAYYASSQVQLFLIEKYGLPKAIAMLKSWGEGEQTPEVIERALGASPEEVDEGYRKWLRKRLSRYDAQFVPDLRGPSLEEAKVSLEKGPKTPRKYVELALALLSNRRTDEAKVALDAALSINPIDGEARYLQARLHQASGQSKAARELLVEMVRTGSDGYATRMLLAEVDLGEKKLEAARYNLKLAHEFDPTLAPPLRVLYELERDAGRKSEALRLLEEVARIDQHDRRAWGLLLEGLVESEAWEKARKVGESAMFIDVANPDVHILYARALSAGKLHKKAIFELESALACSPVPKTAALAHARLAKEHQALGQLAQAKAARDEALRLDPGNAEAKALALP